MILEHIAQREGKLLTFLRRELALSSTLVKRLKYSGAYTVNGEKVFTNYMVRPGDIVKVCLDEPHPEYPPEDGELRILYEDDALIAIDKPAGILMHPSSSRNTGTLTNFLWGYYRRTGQACAVHPVSRLDRDTFGVVLFAKNAHVHALMCSGQGDLQKTYHAAVYGVPSAPEGIIDAPIARREGSSLLRCIREDGKVARSHYRVLDTGCPDGKTPCALLELQPLTGRTHQLRLHCAHMGCPILGDPQYPSAPSAALSERLGLQWQQLCAVRLTFCHPMTKKFLEISSEQTVCLDFCPGADV